MKKRLIITICLFASIALIGCESKEKGTGFSKDKEAIKLLDDDTHMDVVIDGRRYALNDKFSAILENGWKLNEEAIKDLGIENFAGLRMKPMKIAEFTFENEDNRTIQVTVINDSTEETIDIKDAKIVKMNISSGKDKKKGPIVLNGVTEGTSLSDLEERLDALKIKYKSKDNVVYFSESKPIKGELRFIMFEDMVNGITLEDKAFDEYSFGIYKTPLELQKQEDKFKQTAKKIEGVVDDLYEKEVTLSDSSAKLPGGSIAVATTAAGTRFAISYNSRWSQYEDIELKTGDKVIIYYESESSITDVDGKDISRITADVMIVNDSVTYSIFE